MSHPPAAVADPAAIQNRKSTKPLTLSRPSQAARTTASRASITSSSSTSASTAARPAAVTKPAIPRSAPPMRPPAARPKTAEAKKTNADESHSQSQSQHQPQQPGATTERKSRISVIAKKTVAAQPNGSRSSMIARPRKQSQTQTTAAAATASSSSIPAYLSSPSSIPPLPIPPVAFEFPSVSADFPRLNSLEILSTDATLIPIQFSPAMTEYSHARNFSGSEPDSLSHSAVRVNLLSAAADEISVKFRSNGITHILSNSNLMEIPIEIGRNLILIEAANRFGVRTYLIELINDPTLIHSSAADSNSTSSNSASDSIADSNPPSSSSHWAQIIPVEEVQLDEILSNAGANQRETDPINQLILQEFDTETEPETAETAADQQFPPIEENAESNEAAAEAESAGEIILIPDEPENSSESLDDEIHSALHWKDSHRIKYLSDLAASSTLRFSISPKVSLEIHNFFALRSAMPVDELTSDSALLTAELYNRIQERDGPRLMEIVSFIETNGLIDTAAQLIGTAREIIKSFDSYRNNRKNYQNFNENSSAEFVPRNPDFLSRFRPVADSLDPEFLAALKSQDGTKILELLQFHSESGKFISPDLLAYAIDLLGFLEKQLEFNNNANNHPMEMNSGENNSTSSPTPEYSFDAGYFPNPAEIELFNAVSMKDIDSVLRLLNEFQSQPFGPVINPRLLEFAYYCFYQSQSSPSAAVRQSNTGVHQALQLARKSIAVQQAKRFSILQAKKLSLQSKPVLLNPIDQIISNSGILDLPTSIDRSDLPPLPPLPNGVLPLLNRESMVSCPSADQNSSFSQSQPQSQSAVQLNQILESAEAEADGENETETEPTEFDEENCDFDDEQIPLPE